MIFNFTLAMLVVALFATLQARPQEASSPTRAQRPASQAGKPAQGSDSIKGRVTGEGGRPVSGVAITALPINTASNPQRSVASMFRPSTTDAAGKFELSGLQPGVYTVFAGAVGYVLSDSSSNAFVRPGDSVVLTLVKGGVITGRVTNSSGDPLVSAPVRVVKTRELDNSPLRPNLRSASFLTESSSAILGPFKTDDRGVYRIFGLSPGYYQVATGGRDPIRFTPDAEDDGYALTYFPSSGPETAEEVRVQAGEEVTNVDIRHRELRGHALSGKVSDPSGLSPRFVQVILGRPNIGMQEAMTSGSLKTEAGGFEFEALNDGEYIVSAIGGSGDPFGGAEGIDAMVSKARRVTISGADVSGIDLVLEPLGSISGQALIDRLQATAGVCANNPSEGVDELALSVHEAERIKPEEPVFGLLSMVGLKHTTPNPNGDFTITLLRPGAHRLEIELPGEHLYVKSITLPGQGPKAKPVDAAKSGIRLKSGEKLKGLVVTASEGAAGLRGRVVPGEQKKSPLKQLRLHLVPAEPEAADEVLRYYEADVASDGGFSLKNLAPGKYRLLAREIADQREPEDERKPLAWDAGDRLGLIFDGEASAKTIELGRCQRVVDFMFTYVPLIKPSTAPVKKPAD